MDNFGDVFCGSNRFEGATIHHICDSLYGETTLKDEKNWKALDIEKQKIRMNECLDQPFPCFIVDFCDGLDSKLDLPSLSSPIYNTMTVVGKGETWDFNTLNIGDQNSVSRKYLDPLCIISFFILIKDHAFLLCFTLFSDPFLKDGSPLLNIFSMQLQMGKKILNLEQNHT